MTLARIYSPDKNAMQSGKAKMGGWVLEFKPDYSYFVDNLMGWVGLRDTKREIILNFDSQEAAVAYAENQAIPYELSLPNPRKMHKKAYAENFSYKRVQ